MILEFVLGSFWNFAGTIVLMVLGCFLPGCVLLSAIKAWRK